MAKINRVNGVRDYHGRWRATKFRVCRDCGAKLPRTEFPSNGKTKAGNPHYKSVCHKCYSKLEARHRHANPKKYKRYYRRYHRKHRAQRNASVRRYWAEIRQRGFKALGGKCVHCGRTNIRILSFGHIKNDGAAHRRRLKYPGAVYLDWDKRGWPKDEVELQCYNYNLGGVCE